MSMACYANLQVKEPTYQTDATISVFFLREGFKLKKVKNDGIFHVGPDPPPYDGKSFLNFFGH